MKLFMCLPVLISIFFQEKDNQFKQLNVMDNKVFEITDIKGDLKDIEKFFFLNTEKISCVRNGVKIKYIKSLNTFYFTKNEMLLAYYNCVAKKDSIIIDNFSPLRDSVSFIDTEERQYLIKLSNSSEIDSLFFTMKVLNSSNCRTENKLKNSILIYFRKIVSHID